MGLAVLFCLQGIPAIYYGTEQGFQGTLDKNDLHPEQSVREALWGKPNAFDNQSFFFSHIKTLSRLREEQPALRFGRLYFRQVSANGRDFGHSAGRAAWWRSPASSVTSRCSWSQTLVSIPLSMDWFCKTLI